MASITVKNIPDDLYEKLKEAAALHHRSVNSEIIVCLERALAPYRLSSEQAIAEAKALRQGIKGNSLSVSELTEAKDWGRP